ncbi:MAG: methyltransferase domain-containing protein [Bacteroidetes bacterium]|jgi:predicted SAM-dependent methyltransferase|nr:methyltransferase domain-containing protein [Bacteroidota bacterium]MBK9317449.1 methyltransferase domain-containing protein [Bacteroidota bacterium]
MEKLYVQYGCGLSAPQEWINFDVSPTLRVQKTPLIGSLLKSQLNTSFPSNVKYGDITKGLPIADNSCDGLYCSHTLEHLSLLDFREALKNSYKILKKGGIFRCIVPDLEHISRQYIKDLDSGDNQASVKFINNTLMGITERQRGVKGLINTFLGNAHHMWMWDTKSLAEELRKAGFTAIRACKFNDSEDAMFKHVENAERFENAVAIECRK